MEVPSRLRLVEGSNPAGSPPGDGGDPVKTAPDHDANVIAGWVLATAPRAVAFATSLLRDRDKAEEIVQDCYCRLLEKADTYDLARDGIKLLLKAISNACINVQARRRWIKSLFGSEGEPREIGDPKALDPSARLLERELAELIAQGLAKLPIRQRAALELKSLGHSAQDIAEILGVSPTNAGVLIHRARAAMEAHLAPYRQGGTP